MRTVIVNGVYIKKYSFEFSIRRVKFSQSKVFRTSVDQIHAVSVLVLKYLHFSINFLLPSSRTIKNVWQSPANILDTK